MVGLPVEEPDECEGLVRIEETSEVSVPNFRGDAVKRYIRQRRYEIRIPVQKGPRFPWDGLIDISLGRLD